MPRVLEQKASGGLPRALSARFAIIRGVNVAQIGDPMEHDSRDELIARLAAAVVAVSRARSLPAKLPGLTPAGYDNPAYVQAWHIAESALAQATDWLAEYAAPG